MNKHWFASDNYSGVAPEAWQALEAANAAHANQCARYLSEQLGSIDGMDLLVPTEANGVFINIRADIASHLRSEGWKFYDFIGEGGARLMCSWSTTRAEIDAFCQDAHC